MKHTQQPLPLKNEDTQEFYVDFTSKIFVVILTPPPPPPQQQQKQQQQQKVASPSHLAEAYRDLTSTKDGAQLSKIQSFFPHHCRSGIG